MTFFSVENTRLDNRLYSVTGAFCLILKTMDFYRQPDDDTMQYLLEPNTYTVFISHVNGDFIHPHLGVTILIPIAPSPKLTASQHPAVSSLMAYPTPAH